VSWRRVTHQDLGWNQAPVDEFDAGRVQELLARRYDIGMKACRHTLPRLLLDGGARRTLLALRAAGWLDWQILSAISAIGTAWRVSASGLHLYEPDGTRMANQLMSGEAEPTSTSVPLTEFTRKHLEIQLDANLLSTLSMMGLACRQQTPDFAALRSFAKSKMRYFDDDMPHVDCFAANDAQDGST